MRRKTAIPTDAYKVLISGDREWTNREIIKREIATLPPFTIIIHGAARGVDTLADQVADELGLSTIMCPAHWKCNTSLWIAIYGHCASDCQEISGRPAGIIRNIWMLDTYQPDYLIAFHPNIDVSRGTRNAISEAKQRRIPGKLIGQNGTEVARW